MFAQQIPPAPPAAPLGNPPPANAAGGLPPLPPVPPEFRDADGQVRVAALWQAYVALQQRLAATPPHAPAATPPESPEGYCIDCGHGLFESDPAINAALHKAGYSNDQAQLLYDLAAQHLVPAIRQIADGAHSDRETEKLVAHFGGADKWRQVSRQLQAWGNKHLPPAAVEALATTFEGVMALYKMMKEGEPATLRGSSAEGGDSQNELFALMRDPRYWRDRDPRVVAQVTDGFRRLYPGD